MPAGYRTMMPSVVLREIGGSAAGTCPSAMLWDRQRLVRLLHNGEIMAERTGDCSNSLYDTLADWEAQLKHANVTFEEPSP